jgi:hypothetical protein
MMVESSTLTKSEETLIIQHTKQEECALDSPAQKAGALMTNNV